MDESIDTWGAPRWTRPMGSRTDIDGSSARLATVVALLLLALFWSTVVVEVTRHV